MSALTPYLPDANIWLNVLNSTADNHKTCRSWLDQTTSRGAALLVNDLTECALLRAGTHPQLGIATPESAMALHKSLLKYSFTLRAIPSENHLQILHQLIFDLSLVFPVLTGLTPPYLSNPLNESIRNFHSTNHEFF